MLFVMKLILLIKVQWNCSGFMVSACSSSSSSLGLSHGQGHNLCYVLKAQILSSRGD